MGSTGKRRKKTEKKQTNISVSFLLFSFFPIWSSKNEEKRHRTQIIWKYRDVFLVFPHIWDTSNYSSNRSRCMAGNSRSSSKWAGHSRKNISLPDSLYQRNRANERSNISRYLANPGFLLLHKRYDKQKTKTTPNITRNNNNKKNLITYM